MQSITRDAYFGLAGIVILGVVVWILITQVGLGGGEQANGEVATAEPQVAQTELPTVRSPDAPTSDANDAIEEEATPTPTPLPEFHVVQAGETLSQIAGLYGLTPDAIAAKNRLDDPNAILAGQRLLHAGAQRDVYSRGQWRTSGRRVHRSRRRHPICNSSGIWPVGRSAG